MALSIIGRHYYFACELLWCVLSINEYLIEDVSDYQGFGGKLYLTKWSAPYAKFTNWALEERWVPIDLEQIPDPERGALFRAADSLSDPLMFRWTEACQRFARGANDVHAAIDELLWLYYCYCDFLRQVLIEFERVSQESAGSYYGRYQRESKSFEDFPRVLEQERPALDAKSSVGATTWERTLAEMDAVAIRLGSEWREAVSAAAREAGDYSDRRGV